MEIIIRLRAWLLLCFILGSCGSESGTETLKPADETAPTAPTPAQVREALRTKGYSLS